MPARTRMSNPTTRPPCSNYVSYKAIAMSFFRLFFPHAAVFGAILKWLRIVPRAPGDGGGGWGGGVSSSWLLGSRV